MPELPEVETVRRDLERQLVGAHFSRVKVSKRWASLRHKKFQGIANFRRRLIGRKVERIERRGKFLLIGLDRGWLILHLGMSGRLSMFDRRRRTPALKHLHACFQFNDGRELCFEDARTFGRLQAVDDLHEIMGLQLLGPDALTVTPRELANRLRKRKTKIKSALMNAAIIAGLGNIYADESLWESQIHPERRCDSLTQEEFRRLTLAIHKVLKRAIRDGGTSFDAVYQLGRHEPLVYGRRGEPCYRCGTKIRRGVIGNRSFFFCSRCQPLSRRGRAQSRA